MGLRQPGQASLPEYDQMRQQTKQRFAAQGQQQNDALQRRLAAIGNLNSGAAIKQEQNVNNDVAQQQQTAMTGVDQAEAAEVERRKEIGDNQSFTAGEAQKQRDYSTGEAQKQRDFAGTQQQQQQQFTGDQSAIQRKLQSDQFDKTFNATQGQNTFMNNMAMDEAKQNEFMTHYNAALSMASSGQSQDAIANAWKALFPDAPQGMVNGAQANAAAAAADAAKKKYVVGYDDMGHQIWG